MLDPAEALPGIGPIELAQLDRCLKIYNDLYHSWDDETLRFTYRQNAYEYWRHYSEEISSTARALDLVISEPYRLPATAMTDRRRAVLNAYGETGYLDNEWLGIAQSYVEDFAEDGYGHYILALMLAARQEHQPALQHFEDALRFGHDPFWVRYNRAELLRKIGDYPAALEDIQTAVALNQSHPRAQELLSEINRVGAPA